MKYSEYDQAKDPTYMVNITADEACINKFVKDASLKLSLNCGTDKCIVTMNTQNYYKINYISKKEIVFLAVYNS